MRFSPDGKRFAFVATRQKHQFVVIDKVEGPEYDAIGNGTPVFSPDSKRVIYSAKRGEEWFLVIDGEPRPQQITDRLLRFSPDGLRMGWVIVSGALRAAVVDNAPGPWFDEVSMPLFSSDGKKTAHMARSGTRYHMVEDGRDLPVFDEIAWRGLMYASNNVLVYPARKKDKWQVIVGDREGNAYDEIFTRPDGTFPLRPDGTILCFARAGTRLLKVTLAP